MTKTSKRPDWERDIQRERILRAALKIFLKKGYHQTRIEDLVREAEASKSTFYLYFDDKEDLLCHAIDLFFQELRMALNWTQEAIDPSIPLRKVFEQEAKRILQSLVAHQDVALLVFRVGTSGGSKVEKKVANFTHEMVKVSTETLDAAVAFGLMPKVDTRAAATSIVGSIAFAYGLWLDEGGKASPEKVSGGVLDFLLRGCGLPL